MPISELLGWGLIALFLLIVGGIVLCAAMDREWFGIDQ